MGNTRRIYQRTDRSLKALRCPSPTDLSNLPLEADALDALIATISLVRTARRWVKEEQVREILERKQISAVSPLAERGYSGVHRSIVRATE